MSICSPHVIAAIEQFLRERAWTVKELAEEMGLSPHTVRCGIWCVREDRKRPVQQRALIGHRPSGSGRQPCLFWIEEA